MYCFQTTLLKFQQKLGLGQLSDDALVFPNPDGEVRSPNAFSKEWRRTAAKLKVRQVSFHAFRHTHASQLIAAGMDVLTISAASATHLPQSPSGFTGTSSRTPTTRLRGSWSGVWRSRRRVRDGSSGPREAF